MSTTLLHDARILTMDAAGREIERGWLLVEGDTIRALGSGEAPPRTEAERVDCAGDLVMPGFVNAHAHLAMTLFRGLAEDIDDRLYRYILPLERRFVTAEVVRAGTALAAAESIRGGVTTLADMYYFETQVGRVLAHAGLRGVVGQTIADFAAPDHADMEAGWRRVADLVAEFEEHPLVTPSLAPHAPYSTGLATLERVVRWSADHPALPVQMHLAESDLEVRWARENHDATPVRAIAPTGVLRANLLGAHVIHVDERDVALLAENGVRAATNPRSNGKAGRGIAPVERLRAAGIPVGIGTDGPMSGNTLDLFAQLAPVSMFAKLLAGSRRPLPARDVVRMATVEGARALGLEARIGSLEPGKQADLLRVDLSAARLQPIYDTHAALVFAATPADIRATMVAGRWLMRDRVVETVDEAKAVADARQIALAFGAEMRRIDEGTAP
ncbi:amidohydrolase family protein [Aureimonas jatrophae]|uniref:Cytosine/adenosine deaminase n=1 Tax=Aureimonas jatrophae TaxID=1166073 RepID=A0A1H0F5A8_9HYPH|nr:amidohydrolase [Aureimonas jatrophae]MBB3950171.1 cytosine/adenosine deaminase-related metal-dependent hydrolase [Aureimonas jatrophae]SDN89830.1 Cytosine/adenosine deaminase [Aureimonas jatrophae]